MTKFNYIVYNQNKLKINKILQITFNYLFKKKQINQNVRTPKVIIFNNRKHGIFVDISIMI